MRDLRIKKIRDSIVDKAQDLRVKKVHEINNQPRYEHPSECLQKYDIKQYTTHKSSEDKDLIVWKRKYEGVTKIDAKV
jgi:hypothetical protein